ncbi:MAG: hypothetical protein N2D54_07555, partial [Chloroflexota bacterium]
SEAGFDTAVVSAAELADFDLLGIAMRRMAGQSQFLWVKRGENIQRKTTEPAAELQKTAIKTLLKESGEPRHYLYLQNAALLALAREKMLIEGEENPGDSYNQVRDRLKTGLTFQGGFLRYGGTEHSLETGRWWLRDDSEVKTPLADHVEMFMVSELVKHETMSFAEIESAVLADFRGLFTPPKGLISSVLNSYAKADEVGEWRLRENDSPTSRREDLEEMKSILVKIGKQIGLTSKVEDSLVSWAGADNRILYAFHLIASGMIGELLKSKKTKAEQYFFVVPGGRTILILDKLKNNPHLAKIQQDEWEFVKFRWVRRLAENTTLTLETITEQFGLDPLAEDDAQLPLF